MWEVFDNVLTQDLVDDVKTSDVVSKIINKDIKYQAEERPGRGEQDDKHSSVVRDYLIENKYTAGYGAEKVFEKMQEDLSGDEMRPLISELATKWESNHPGENFYATPEASAA